MRKTFILAAALSLPSAVLCPGIALAQGGAVGNWTSAGNDPGHSGWQKNETKISKQTAGATFKYLWKIKLGQATQDTQTFSEPLLALRLIKPQGFQDLLLWGITATLYA